MENTTAPAPKRSRRTPEQWHAILAEHLAGSETVEDLARRLACQPSTVEMRLKKLTAPDARRSKVSRQFVEVETLAARCAPQAHAVRLQTVNGVIVTFASLPPPEYLAKALGIV